MEAFVTVILNSGKTAIELALYILLPVMVVMMALMKVLESKGILAFTARVLSPGLLLFGVPGIGAFAILQLHLVSFAAPVSTLAIMERDVANNRRLAATLAMILSMSQANVVFPMAAIGLDVGMLLVTSAIGGVVASTLTYYLFARSRSHPPQALEDKAPQPKREETGGLLNQLLTGGREGLEIVIRAIPLLILAIFLINFLDLLGVVAIIEWAVSPFLERVGLPGVAVLPIATKFLAGGTAMMGVTLDLVEKGSLSVAELNRLAGFVINPLDLVGVSVLASAGPRVASVMRPAIAGAIVGVATRGVLHLVIF